MGPRGAGLIRGIDAARAACHRLMAGGRSLSPLRFPIIQKEE